MDCVYDAYLDHIWYIGIPTGWTDRAIYRILKVATHGPSPQPTNGATVPFIIGTLARLHGFRIRVQYDTLLTPEVVAGVSDNLIQRWLERRCPGEAMRPPTLTPAIYLVASINHAMFAEEVPPGLVHMAIQIYRKGD